MLEQGTVPPSYGDYDQWPADDGPDNPGFFLALYQLVRHRPGMTSVDRVRDWFLASAVRRQGTAQYVSMSQAADVRVTIEHVGGELGSDVSVITAENLEKLHAESLTPIDALMLFEPAGGSASDVHRRRLFFLLSYWHLDSVEFLDQMPPSAPVFCLASPGRVVRGAVHEFEPDARRRMVRLRNESACAYLLPESGADGGALDVAAFVRQYASDDATAQVALQAVRQLTLGMCKSLLQKLIRTGADVVNLVGVCPPGTLMAPTIPATPLLAAVAVRMLGLSMFNPHGGGLETGAVALFKRAAIVAMEDAWPEALDEAAAWLEWLTVCAAYARSRRNWKPPASYVACCVAGLEACRRSRTACTFSIADFVKLPPLVFPTDGSARPRDTVRFLFEHFLRGMDGDLGMIRCIHMEGLRLAAAPTAACITEMPIYHFIDQHCMTAFVYLLPPDGVAASLVETCRESFGGLFSRVFSRVTGINPRRAPAKVSLESSIESVLERSHSDVQFLREVQTAQMRAWMSLIGDRTRLPGESTRDFVVKKPYDWIAYEVGVQRITVDGVKYLWTLGTQDSCEISVARQRDPPAVSRRPVAVAAAADDDDDDDDVPIASSHKRALSTGDDSAAKRLAAEAENNEEAEHQRVRDAVGQLLRDEGIHCSLGTIGIGSDQTGLEVITVNGEPWENAREYHMDVPTTLWSSGTVPQDSLAVMRMSLDVTTMRERLHEAIRCVRGVTAAGRALALAMMRSPSRHLVFPRPARDGGPSRDAAGAQPLRVHLEAWLVCKAIADWSALLMCPRSGGELSIFDTPAEYLDLRIEIASRLAHTKWSTISPEECDRAVTSSLDWFQDRRGQHMFSHQERAERLLAYRVVDGAHRAHFLWMEMGAGKTTTALVFAVLLQILRQRAPEKMHCLFLTAPSALESVLADIKSLNISCLTLEQSRGRLARVAGKLGHYNVLLATHDTIKSADSIAELSAYASKALVVVDEVHRCTGIGTKRAAAIQLLANIAGQVLFMTATPVRSVREKASLRALLQHVANFPCVTDNDFLVACNAMVHPRIHARIPVEDVLLCAETEETQPLLMRHIPARLGGLSNDERLSTASLQQALLDAYEVTDAFIVDQVLAEIAAGNRPFVVCRTYDHVEAMRQRLYAAGLSEQQIMVAARASSIQSVTADTNTNPHLCVALVPMHQSTGYSATYFNVRLRGVFPSNEADRAQIDGRIVRPGQREAPVRLVTVHCGITSLIVRRHLEAASTVRLIDELNAIRIG